VGGKLREVYYQGGIPVAENPDFFRMGDAVEDAYQLGGNAMYRRAALEAVGSFDPYIHSHEEAELAERLRKAGYRIVRIPLTVGTHHTALRGSLEELWRRFRSNLMTGFGQVLRVSIRDGLFWAHARQLNRYLLTLAFLAVGAASGVAAELSGRLWPIAAWAAAGLAFVLGFVIRSRSLRIPLAVITEWVLSAPAIVWGFVRAPGRRDSFDVRCAIESVNGMPYKPQARDPSEKVAARA
jgi:hypothetical protein